MKKTNPVRFRSVRRASTEAEHAILTPREYWFSLLVYMPLTPKLRAAAYKLLVIEGKGEKV